MSTTTRTSCPSRQPQPSPKPPGSPPQAARQSTETAKASIEAARSYLDEANTLGRELLGTWATQSEAALKAAFDAQNAAIDVGLGLFDLGVKGNRQAVEQFSSSSSERSGRPSRAGRPPSRRR